MTVHQVLAVIGAALAGFVIGGLWYSPALLRRRWMQAAALDDAAVRGGKVRIFVGAFVLLLIAALNLAMFLGRPATLAWGVSAGALTALWVICALGVLYLFERRPLALFLINAGYWLVTFMVMGAVLSLW